MITIFNRKELIVTTEMNRQAQVTGYSFSEWY